MSITQIMNNINIDNITIIFLGIILILLAVFFYVLIRVRILIKSIFKNMNAINLKLKLIGKNKNEIPDIHLISDKLKELSDKLKNLNDIIKGKKK